MEQPWPSMKEVHQAVIACSKRKRKRPDAIAFRACYGEEVLSLTERLQSGTYKPQPGVVFVTDRPKYREIHAARFRDRVVHHLLHAQLEPVFERSFINDSYACRIGKGTHAAVYELQNKMRQITRQGKVRAYAMQLDIKSFFHSIHKPTLFNLLKSKKSLFTNGEKVLDLTRIVIYHNMAHTSHRIGSISRFKRIPEHKRLGSQGVDKGIPIGNLTSQFFGNVYLNVLDQFVKRTLGVRSYLRFVDDFILLHTNKQRLLVWQDLIRKFLRERLQLQLHEKFIIQPISTGVDFLGYMIRPHYILPRRRVISHAHRRLSVLEKDLKPMYCDSYRVWPINYEFIQYLRSSWASYGGHCRHSDCRNTLKRLWEKHPISRFYLSLNRSFNPRFGSFRYDYSWKKQIQRLSMGTKNSVLLVQVGYYMECPRYRDYKLLRLLSLTKQGRVKAGVPRRMLYRFIRKILARNIAVALALQQREVVGRLRARSLTHFLEPRSSKKILSVS